MNKKRIVIRCLTQATKGYGNLSRCLYVADSLRKNNFKVSFVIDYDRSVIKILKKRRFDYIAKPKTTISIEAKFILDYAHKNQYEAIIIDMREYGERLSKLLVGHNFKTILFDDAWCKNIYTDMVFNGTNVKSYHQYKKINKNAKLFLGTKYWIVNDEFQYHKKNITDIYVKKQYQVIVSMGGADPNNLTTYVVKALLGIQNIKINVIIGPLFHHLSKLKKIISNNKIKLIYSTNKMWIELSKADIAISNGGNTLFELATLGIPTLCIPAFKHEIQYVNEFTSKSFAINLGFKQKNSNKINNALINILANTQFRKKMCLSGNEILDGKGLSRVVSIISRFLQ